MEIDVEAVVEVMLVFPARTHTGEQCRTERGGETDCWQRREHLRTGSTGRENSLKNNSQQLITYSELGRELICTAKPTRSKHLENKNHPHLLFVSQHQRLFHIRSTPTLGTSGRDEWQRQTANKRTVAGEQTREPGDNAEALTCDLRGSDDVQGA